MRPLEKSDCRPTIEVLAGGKKKAKEKALNDITNKLESRHMRLKPTWVGPKVNTCKEGAKSSWAAQEMESARLG